MHNLLFDVKPEVELTESHGIGRFKAGEGVGDIEQGPTVSFAAPDDSIIVDSAMDDFYMQVRELKNQIDQMHQNLKSLQNSHRISMNTTKADELRDLRRQMQNDITHIGQLARDAKSRTEILDKENETARLKSGKGAETSEDRTRTSITVNLKRKLKDVLTEFTALRGRIRDDYRDVVARKYFEAMGQEVEGEALEKMIESGESEHLFASSMADAGRGHVTATVALIDERHNAFMNLERQLLALNQIFLDMSVLVEAQGEMLDNIEGNVNKAKEHVESGNIALASAKKIQKNTRKWMCCAIWILLIIVSIIVVAVLKPWELGEA
mmetsp:Transcript_21595/g.30016  ORF Transcript_21595/g.30016 Transcript_21595/m.30016 type:complete len:324 (-) Transcript_21595:54-1025(-)|eukprot:CAMPEP_0196573698 /NCGR_PEP_ID=MMETSP1081-20130531/3564_1 /TAXON_ID=36882 /ORGANISM="Pyramimonas amylifera, Strain CCMP720" /LENGTH=323 /DNA_ID=CAMNT_0041891513 /DNA_START=101 /DNA_END=1072 /DNA_ORIENTATION=-